MPEEVIHSIEVNRIELRPQVRTQFDDRDITGLAMSMRAVGQLSPVRVRRDGELFPVVDGARRTLAAKKLNWPTIAAIVESDDIHETDVLERSLIANCQRADLTPIEKARGIEELIQKTGRTASEAAGRLGMSKADVSRIRSLLSLPEEMQAAIQAGTLPASTAYEIYKLPDPDAQRSMAKEVIEQGLTREGVVRRLNARAAPKPNGAAQVSRARIDLGEGRVIAVSGSDLSLDRLIQWIEELMGIAKKARTKGWELGTLVRSLKDQARASARKEEVCG